MGRVGRGISMLAMLGSLVACAGLGEPAPFLALGDSYTIGQGAEEADRWPVQLHDQLGGDLLGPPWIVAQTGWTTRNLLDAMDAEGLDGMGEFGLVTLMIGVNNQYQGEPIDEFEAELDVLIARAIALGGGEPGRVVVVSIPDWTASPFGERRLDPDERAANAAEIDAFNVVVRTRAADAGVAWVDVTAASRTSGDAATAADAGGAPAEGEAADEFVRDGLHPGRVQYAAWVDAILPAARAALGE